VAFNYDKLHENCFLLSTVGVSVADQSFVSGPKLCGNLKGNLYRVFHGFWQAKFPNSGLFLGSSQFSILPQLPPKILLDSKVVKID
jgi:hypothetical protein